MKLTVLALLFTGLIFGLTLIVNLQSGVGGEQSSNYVSNLGTQPGEASADVTVKSASSNTGLEQIAPTQNVGLSPELRVDTPPSSSEGSGATFVRGVASDPEAEDPNSSVLVIRLGSAADPGDEGVGIDTYEGPTIVKGEPEDPESSGLYDGAGEATAIKRGEPSDPSEPEYYAPSIDQPIRQGEASSPDD